jgi:outer membrane protein assembly factor BamB
MHCVDARTGRPRWQAPVPEPGYSRAAPVIVDDLVHYAGGRHSLDLVSVSRWGSGEPEVTFSLTLEPRPSRASREPSAAYAGAMDVTPVIGGGAIVVSGKQLHARWLGPTGPQMHWDAEPPWYRRAAAATVAGALVYGAGHDYRDETVVQAVALAAGSPVWQTRLGEGPVGRPVVDGGEVFVPAGTLHVLDPRDGAPLWTVAAEREWLGAVAVTPAYVVGTTCRLAAPHAGDDRPQWCFTVVCVDRRTRGIAWTFTAPERSASAGVVVADGTVYSIGHDDARGTLYAVDLATGRLRWRADLGRTSGLPTVAGGRVYTSTMDGVLAAFDA